MFFLTDGAAMSCYRTIQRYVVPMLPQVYDICMMSSYVDCTYLNTIYIFLCTEHFICYIFCLCIHVQLLDNIVMLLNLFSLN